MLPSDKSEQTKKFSDDLSEIFFGRKRSDSILQDTCVSCGTPVYQLDFSDAISRQEYSISDLCQKCQDRVFG